MSEEKFSSLVARATILIKDQQWSDALKCLLEAEMLARLDFGEEDRRVASVLDKQHFVYKTLGRGLEAERALHGATRIHVKHIRRKGRSLAEQQKYADAEKEFREAVRICERAYGADHRETATCIDNLATCLRSQSLFVEAVTLAARAMEIRRTVLGDGHAHTAASFSNVGYLFRLLGRFEEAQELLVRSVVVREKVLGPGHPAVAESLDRLASLCRDLGQFDEAVTLCERALRIRREQLGDSHPLTAASINNLALGRERRGGDVITVATESSSSAGQQDRAAAVAVEPSKIAIRESHVTGYWIAGLLAIGLPTAGATFWYIPALGMVIGIAATSIGVIGIVYADSVESLMRYAGAKVKRVLTEEHDVDRDAVVLGKTSSDGRTEIEARTGKGQLAVKDARELVGYGVDPLDLSFVHSLTQAAADELSKHRGTLMLNGLREMRSKLAKSLRWHEGSLEINSVPELTAAAAAHIARHAGDLCLNGLRELRCDIAEHLAHHKGMLRLNAVRSLNEDAARWLIKHRGTVQLHECRLTSDETKRILRTNSQIEFPGQ